MGEQHVASDETPLERRNWFAGRLVTAEDLDAEQTYFREKQRRRNRLLHGWGVVEGLEVAAGDDLTLVVTAGFALDSAGNRIVVPDQRTVDAERAGLLAAGATGWLVIRWDECPSGELPSAEPDLPAMTAAWREDFEVMILNEAPPEDEHDPSAHTATPWLALATVVWDGDVTLTLDTSVRRPLQRP